MKNISEFLSENFHFLVVKFSVYLNRHVFVMSGSNCPCLEQISKVIKVLEPLKFDLTLLIILFSLTFR